MSSDCFVTDVPDRSMPAMSERVDALWLLDQKMLIFSVRVFLNHSKAGLPNPLPHLRQLGIVMIPTSLPPMIPAFREPFGLSIDRRQAHVLTLSKGRLDILLPGALDREI